MTVWFIILLVIVLAFLLINIVLYFIQEKFIFDSEKLPKNYKFTFDKDFEEIFLKTDDGQKLNAIHFKIDNPLGLLLYFHNNSGNLKRWGEAISFFTHYKYDVLAMDYRGYGKSSGNYDEKFMLDDAQLWYEYAVDLYDESAITVYGRGLGAVFAAKVSAQNHPKKLILEAPIYNLEHTAGYLYPYLPYKLLLKYNFDTAFYFKDVLCDTTIFHGKEDKYVHFTSSLKLFDMRKEMTDLVLLKNTDHFNVMIQPKYIKTIEQIL